MDRFEWQDEPYRHTTGTDFFPAEMYAEMLENLPPDAQYVSYSLYPKRSVYAKPKTKFWQDVFDFVRGGIKSCRVSLTRDIPGYFIGPHTDSKEDKTSFVFYLTDKPVEGMGTVLFDAPFECSGGKHHQFRGFKTVKEIPYAPNSYFGFVRSDRSFHGVMPIKETRNTLQMTVYEW